MHFRIIAVGRDRSGLYQPAVDEYLRRIVRYAKLELVEVAEARKQAGTPLAKEEECDNLLAKLSARDRVVALHERGKLHDSVALAGRLRSWVEGGRDVALVLGGSDGLSERLLARADERLSLSPLTLAHRLARLVLVEQIYRGFTILRGEPYHK